MDKIENAKHRAGLILPKLERMRSTASHELLQHLALVRNYFDMLNNNYTSVSPEILADDLIGICDKAEKFMMEAVR